MLLGSELKLYLCLNILQCLIFSFKITILKIEKLFTYYKIHSKWVLKHFHKILHLLPVSN